MSDTEHSGGGAATLDREVEQLTHQEPLAGDDHERSCHYGHTAWRLKSALTGRPVIALCGKVWTPGRDPQKFPVCPVCKEIYESMKK